MKYKLIRSKRKSIAIEIDRAGAVTVRAPYRIPNVAVKAFIEDKQDWIREHIKKAQEMSLEAADIEPLTEEELDKLYDEAKEVIPKRVRYYAELMGVDYGRVTIRCQKTCWGSCSSKGNLNFNCLLMLAPSDIIDYVVIHELAHRKFMNHSKNFWKEVEIMIPGYKEKRKWLNTYGEEIMQRKRAME
ncbi:MAG: M48 family metallopeptidase [Lachnospiraceae bacterium]|nr:M48 family metallopeptidase [Lachnospiraceae bacterium]